jgi:multidrug resistance efflux pump
VQSEPSSFLTRSARSSEVKAQRNGTQSVFVMKHPFGIYGRSAVRRRSSDGDRCALDQETMAAMKTTWRLALLAAIVSAATLLIVWFAMRPEALDVAEVTRGELVASLAATGIVETYEAAVSPEITGRVTEVAADEGDRVADGDLLVRLTSAQERAGVAQQRAALLAARAGVARARAALAQERSASTARIAGAEASLQASEARLRDLEAGARRQEISSSKQAEEAARSRAELAESDYRRIRGLRREGAVAQADEDQARTRMESAAAALKQARDALALLEEGARPEQIAAQKATVTTARAELNAARAAAGRVEVLERSVAESEAIAAEA